MSDDLTVAEVRIEPDYWNRGHFYQGRRKIVVEVTSIEHLPVGTKLRAEVPIDMVLHCPACGLQHIDAAEPVSVQTEKGLVARGDPTWNNPPHRSHLCHGCGHIWRPADVPTNGVQAVKTRGKNDSKIVKPGCIECANAVCDECDPKGGVR